MKKLVGKVALVTGSGRGIGRCIALKLAADGARVVVNDLDAEPAEEVVAQIRAAGGEAVACIGSVTAEEFPARFVRTAVDNYGGIDIIVNNAGYGWDDMIERVTDEQWYAMVDCHMTAPFRILRAAQPIISAAAKAEATEGREVMRKVVNISSLAAQGAFATTGYASAKSGVIGLTKTLAKEWGRLKVNVNAVAFGLIETRISQESNGETAIIDGRELKIGLPRRPREHVVQNTPLGRAGTAEEAAGAVYLLCLPESDYVSGQLLTCSGGATSI